MDENRTMQPHEPDHKITDGEDTPDASVMTEGVGGMPDLKPQERATVSDVDGDNVDEHR